MTQKDSSQETIISLMGMLVKTNVNVLLDGLKSILIGRECGGLTRIIPICNMVLSGDSFIHSFSNEPRRCPSSDYEDT